jgi:hypothetical protein
MEEINQIVVPPSFVAVHSDARGKLTASRQDIQARYELCEDLANHLVEQAQILYHDQAPSESEILLRMHVGLEAADAGLAPGEATWIICRLAELLNWRSPALPSTSTLSADTNQPH